MYTAFMSSLHCCRFIFSCINTLMALVRIILLRLSFLIMTNDVMTHGCSISPKFKAILEIIVGLFRGHHRIKHPKLHQILKNVYLKKALIFILRSCDFRCNTWIKNTNKALFGCLECRPEDAMVALMGFSYVFKNLIKLTRLSVTQKSYLYTLHFSYFVSITSRGPPNLLNIWTQLIHLMDDEIITH